MLIVGGNSLIGTHIKTALDLQGELVEETQRECRDGKAISLDLVEPELFNPTSIRSKEAVFCAAATNMLWCEQNPIQSKIINVDGTKVILDKLADHGISGVFLSSSQVFDGEKNLCDENSVVHCKNLYGAQKLEVEQYITEQKLPFSILRLSKIIGTRNLGIFDRWIENLKAGRPINAATNIYLSPVVASDAAEVAIKLATSKSLGVWHLSAPDQLSYAEAALNMADAYGYDISLIDQTFVSETDVSSKFVARFTTLNCKKLQKILGYKAPPSKTVLETIFQKAKNDRRYV